MPTSSNCCLAVFGRGIGRGAIYEHEDGSLSIRIRCRELVHPLGPYHRVHIAPNQDVATVLSRQCYSTEDGQVCEAVPAILTQHAADIKREVAKHRTPERLQRWAAQKRLAADRETNMVNDNQERETNERR